jgi:homoserine dehydrogenase
MTDITSPPDLTAFGADAALVRVGMLGCGTVGAELLRILDRRADQIARETGVRPVVVRAAVRDLGRRRDVPLDASAFTSDPHEVVTAKDVDVVVEVVGGTEPAGDLVAAALESGKPVVTANKELIARRGPELLEIAEACGVDLLFEAAVGGGIPVIRSVTESLAGEHVRRVLGIVNGTTNYVLTRMSEEGSDFAAALAEAQALGYAEADPSADVEGRDAAQKAAILASLAFGTRVSEADVHAEGITHIHPTDVDMARRLGYAIKLLAIAEVDDAGAVSARVHPAMVPLTHPLASVRLSFNAIFVEGDSAGELMLYGRGAGAGPTAIAVAGDVIDAARNLRQRARGPHVAPPVYRTIRPLTSMSSMFYLRLHVVDRPGVLAAVAGILGRHDVSIRSVIQEGRRDDAELVMVTHLSREADMQATLVELEQLEVVGSVAALLRVVGEEDETP